LFVVRPIALSAGKENRKQANQEIQLCFNFGGHLTK
jgi:hypothetical protein